MSVSLVCSRINPRAEEPLDPPIEHAAIHSSLPEEPDNSKNITQSQMYTVFVKQMADEVKALTDNVNRENAGVIEVAIKGKLGKLGLEAYQAARCEREMGMESSGTLDKVIASMVAIYRKRTRF